MSAATAAAGRLQRNAPGEGRRRERTSTETVGREWRSEEKAVDVQRPWGERRFQKRRRRKTDAPKATENVLFDFIRKGETSRDTFDFSDGLLKSQRPGFQGGCMSSFDTRVFMVVPTTNVVRFRSE